ncbi:hypothetical protein AB0B06_08140 [Streptomyces sp. NPDC044989]|uniref:TlpA family protein disulfide reductase n=1 Tax=Streptomyces sp. NPDC044989 TaxID=3154336 RepID=UPI0033DB87EC
MVTISAAVVTTIACAGIAVAIYSALQAKKALEQAADSRVSRVQPLAPGALVSYPGKVTDINGREVELPAGSGAPWVLTFLSSECPGCKRQLRGLRKYLTRHRLSPERVISVVTGEPSTLDGLKTELAEFSWLVRLEEASPIMTGIHISQWPTYVVIDAEDRVAFSSNSVARLASFSFAYS